MSGFTSPYLDTRLDIIARRLIKYPQLVQFIDWDLERILARIGETCGRHYRTDDPKSGSLESQLMQHALEDFRILIRPFSGNERRFFRFAIRWFELVNLKVLIRGKFSHAGNDTIKRQLVDLGSFADLPLTQLLETDDPYEMLRLLETTGYGGIVRQARRVYEEHGNDLFLLDATIDRIFFIDLCQRTRFLRSPDVAGIGRVMDELLDRFNLMWLLRYRFSYGLSAAKSFYLLTTTGHQLRSTQLMRLAKLDNVDSVVAALPQPYRNLLDGVASISDMETIMEYHSLSVAAAMLRQRDNLMSRTFSYILLREAEVRFLQAIIKGKQLDFEKTLIRRAVGVDN